MIQAVIYNPYRILGVFSNSSRREIEQNFSKISRLIAAKKSVSYPGDLESILGEVDRKAAVVKKAKRSLDSSKDKLIASFFWPILLNSSIEAASAIDMICGGRLQEAINVLKGGESLHSHANRAFIGILQGEVDIAISQWFTVFDSESLLKEFIDNVCGEDYTVDSGECKHLFLNALSEEYGAVDLYKKVGGKSIPVDAQSEISVKARNAYVYEIEELIIKYPQRKGRPSFEILYFADNLQKQAEPLLNQFSIFCGDDRVTYQIYADKIAKRLNLLVVAAYNEAFRKREEEKIDELEIVGPNSLDILKRIDTKSLSRKIAEQIAENLQAIERDTAPYIKKREEEKAKAAAQKKAASTPRHINVFGTKEEYVNEFTSLLEKYAPKQGKTSFEILYAAENLHKMSDYLLLDFTDFCKDDKAASREYADKITKQLIALVIGAYREARRKKDDETIDELQIVGPNAAALLRKINKDIISQEIAVDVATNLQYIEKDYSRPSKKKETVKPEVNTEPKPEPYDRRFSHAIKDVESEPVNNPESENQFCALCGASTPNIEHRDYKKFYKRVGNDNVYTHWNIDVPICDTCQQKEKEFRKWKRIGECVVIALEFVGVIFFKDNSEALIWYVVMSLFATWFIAPLLGGLIGKLLMFINNPTLAKHRQHSTINNYPPVKQARMEGFKYKIPWW